MAMPGQLLGVAILAFIATLLIANRSSTGSKTSLLQNENLIVRTYEADVAKGKVIIQKMSGKVHNPVWKKLVGNQATRDILAAALGSDSYLSSHGVKSMTSSLSAVLSGLHQAHVHSSTMNEIVSAAHSGSNKKSITAPQKAKSQKEVGHSEKMPSSHHVHIEYDAFAPGVIPQPAVPVHIISPRHSAKSSQSTAASKAAASKAATLEAIRQGLLGATGLSDNFAPAESPLADLQRKVQRLQASLRQERAKLREAQLHNSAVHDSKATDRAASGAKGQSESATHVLLHTESKASTSPMAASAGPAA
eukprot:CAMPEP_0172177046 /NCGR_PEP_ID=MMETSP1050-20130122/15192_1 /TAXON_ID=233186 /ORGANISM="Cryptomonas curvata, Strain CCAP979/52" /LENGTH=305 /DNA_ID=CAMNT_0012849469 /DNA_START=27 /DNA_END=940 /DNA_ORIENTATION=-